MVCFRHEYCNVCDKETGHYNGKCGECESKRASKERRQHFAALKGLTLEERIERLEKIQYEQSVNPPWREPTY